MGFFLVRAGIPFVNRTESASMDSEDLVSMEMVIQESRSLGIFLFL
jgi:hypothetical protein